MKFKKVEISAFRIFDKPEDATFDFIDKSGDAANFISLYAPNGFGKTSFYDAVEWGMTNKIERFWQSRHTEKNTDESIDTLRELTSKQVELIRNAGSKEKTLVKITTDREVLPARELIVHGRRKVDLNNKGNLERKEFRKVLLSQEWIAAFLQEIDGELRYQKFMENPDLEDIDNYYKNVKSLGDICDKTIARLQAEAEEIKQNILGDDSSLLENINSQISLIKEKYGVRDLELISLSTSQEEIKDLKDLIANQIINCNKSDEITATLSSISVAKIGDGKVVGVDQFFDAKLSSAKAKEELEKIHKNLYGFERLEELNNELTGKQSLKLQLIKEKEQLNKVTSQYAEYKKISTTIAQKKETEIDTENKLTVLNDQLEELKREEINVRNNQESLIKQVWDLDGKKAEVPELKKSIESLSNTVREVENIIAKEQRELGKKEKEINALDESISEFNKIIEEINIDQYSQSLVDKYPKIAGIIENLEVQNAEAYEAKLQLKELNLKIEEQQSLNSTIEEFIKSGLAIVNDSQISSCPLCEQKYESYANLAERITNNQALKGSLQELLAEKSRVSQSISTLTSKIKSNHELLAGFYKKHIKKLVEKRNESNKDFEKQKKDFNRIEADLNIKKERLSAYSIKMDGLTPKEYEKKLDLSLKNLISSRNDATRLFTNITSNIASKSKQINNLTDKKNLISKELVKLEANKKYVTVKDWFTANYPNEPIGENLLTDMSIDLSEKTNNVLNRISELKKDIEVLKATLKSYTKDSLSIKQKKWEEKKHEADSKVASYKHFLKDKLEIDIEQKNKKTLLKLLIEEGKIQKSELKKIQELKNEYQRLEKYSDSLWPFLQSEKAKLELRKNEDELKLLNGKVKPLIELEIEKTKNHLEKKVRDFFYEKLINELYRKINPHPDFKSVEFKPNFDCENPRLDVLVTNEKNQAKLIPNLYFSTSQINILSLSIFLASALNSKDYDCIFIDDPIQSLDSINVLSTIDLLRSIIVNEDKQIILSTHDENFHNLLKKKIPDNLFKSKFLELETFGKVKKEI